MKKNTLIAPFKNIYTWVENTITAWRYHISSLRNYYPCKLVGEIEVDGENKTLIRYRTLGKRDTYTIPIQELLEDRDLIEKFHPTEAIKFGAIAMGDILLSLPEDKRQQKFEEIKQKMLTGTKG